MLNTCVKCGKYSVEKEISKDGLSCICPYCGEVQLIKRQPLFVLTGASETGKTTAATQLYLNEKEYMVMDCDQLWIGEIFNDHEGGYRRFREVWLRLAKNMSHIGKPVVLVGCAVPEQYENCHERRYFSEVHYLALHCEADELLTRLEKKYGVGEDYVDASLGFNQWLKENASLTEPNMALLEVSGLEKEDVANDIHQWIMSKL